MTKNEPFKELPWQYIPEPKIGHYPPVFIYGFPLDDGVSGIEQLARSAGILKPQETIPPRGLDHILSQTLKHFEKKCNLSQEEFLAVDGCYSKTASYVLTLAKNYNVGHIAPKKLDHVIEVIGSYLPGREPQWFLDPDIVDMEYQNFEIPGSSFHHSLWRLLARPSPC